MIIRAVVCTDTNGVLWILKAETAAACVVACPNKTRHSPYGEESVVLWFGRRSDVEHIRCEDRSSTLARAVSESEIFHILIRVSKCTRTRSVLTSGRRQSHAAHSTQRNAKEMTDPSVHVDRAQTETAYTNRPIVSCVWS
uniref:Uncharacterized protein n=1 Tax=Plectus sambesii TaxID=2011161 RepID=A0A914UWX5_9BILA